MIAERLCMEKDFDLTLRESSCESHEFSVVGENAVYYAAGYVIQKLIKNLDKAATMMHVLI